MNTKGNDPLRNLLAAEYALGTLRGAARRRFEAWMRDDAALRQRATEWADHLLPLAEQLADQNPPARVWNAIVARIPALGSPPGRDAAAAGRWLERLSFWRGLSAATTVAAVIAIGFALRPVEGPVTPPPVTQAMLLPSVVATIADDKTGKPLALLMIPERGNELIVRVSADVAVPAGKTLQLWMAPQDAEGLVSAGLIPDGARAGPATLTIADIARLANAKGLGVSLEPAGGSPQPTQVLGKGTWTRLRS